MALRIHRAYINLRPRLVFHSFSTYYDSQSGRYMTVPGTQPIRLHDVSHRINPSIDIKPAELKESALLDIAGVKPEVVEKQIDSARTKFDKLYLLIRLFDRQSNNSSSNHDASHLEYDCFEHLGESKVNSFNDLEECISSIRNKTDTLSLRVNLPIDITSLIENGTPSSAVLDVTTTVGKLCDLDAEVVNLVFCQNSTYDADPTDRLDDVVDYGREIIEECLGLDVPGAAVIDRLSIQACHAAILDQAKSLGVRRFAVVDSALKGHIEYQLDDSTTFRSIDDSRDYEYV